ncbi:hypothetical protein D9Y95_RS13775 [Enterococcus hirae]
MKNNRVLGVIFTGILVNILIFPIVYIYQWQIPIGFLLGISSISFAIVSWKKITVRIQKIGLIAGIVLNIFPLIWFLFLVVALG